MYEDVTLAATVLRRMSSSNIRLRTTSHSAAARLAPSTARIDVHIVPCLLPLQASAGCIHRRRFDRFTAISDVRRRIGPQNEQRPRRRATLRCKVFHSTRNQSVRVVQGRTSTKKLFSDMHTDLIPSVRRIGVSWKFMFSSTN